MEKVIKLYPSSHSRNIHGYGVFQNVPLINFSSENCENPDRGDGHGKSQIWSWKVMEFHFQDFVGTL